MCDLGLQSNDVHDPKAADFREVRFARKLKAGQCQLLLPRCEPERGSSQMPTARPPVISLISILLVFSGVASLIYQVTWVRLLGLSLGSTSASISMVLAAFFLGLAVGSYLTERLTRSGGRSFRLYGLIEGVIALSRLASLPLFLNIDELLRFAPASWVGQLTAHQREVSLQKKMRVLP